MTIAIDEYDPFTCVTAGELRDMGLAVPQSIPDVAWVPRRSIEWGAGQGTFDEATSRLTATITARFTEPFRYIKILIEQKVGE